MPIPQLHRDHRASASPPWDRSWRQSDPTLGGEEVNVPEVFGRSVIFISMFKSTEKDAET